MLISGKEALIALANGECVLYVNADYTDLELKKWALAHELEVQQFRSGKWAFKLKPRTISINGIEVPAPFEPKEGDVYWHVFPSRECGYGFNDFESLDVDFCWMQFGAWRTEEDIKQVVEALRSVFK